MKGRSKRNLCLPSSCSHPRLAAILQRVLSASVTVEKELVSSIGKGVLVFAAVAPGDTEKEAESLAAKVLKMKLWDDENGGRVILSFLLPFFFSPTYRLSDASFNVSGSIACRISMEKCSVVGLPQVSLPSFLGILTFFMPSLPIHPASVHEEGE